MGKRTDLDYLNDIKNEIELIESVIRNCSYEEFLVNKEKQHVIERAIEIISEASKHVQIGYKTHCPEIPWKEIKAMRNMVSHEYMNVDYDIVWETINNDDLKNLKECINKLIEYLS